ncbi:hypothetical protein LCGC14_1679030 [marine sediment metagenome]|uniref:MPN domain-containing protein n=1 Tax=marine sediment metagenome TaxID=412755 RepID=A0A0F9IBM0_9ZZZZ
MALGRGVGFALLAVPVALTAGAAAYFDYRRRSKRPVALAGPAKRRYRGLGQTVTECKRVAPGQRVLLCLTRPKKPGPMITDPDQVCRLLAPAAAADRENFYVISLDARNRVIGVEENARGTLTGVEVHPREVFKGAMMMNANSIIVAHNHPSGDNVISREDIELTRRLVKAGQLVGIPVHDHVIVSADGCTSLAEVAPHAFDGSSVRRR